MIAEKLGVGKPQATFLIAIFLLNPFVIQNTVIDGHNDIFLGLSVVSSYYFVLRKNYKTSIYLLLLGGLVKYLSLIIVPIPLFLLIIEKKWKSIKDLLIIGFISLSTLIILYIPFGLNVSVLTGISKEVAERGVIASASFPTALLQLYLNLSQGAVKILGIILGFVSILYYFRKPSALTYCMPLILILLFGCPWFMPWYGLWVIPILLLSLKWQKIIVISIALVLIIQYISMPIQVTAILIIILLAMIFIDFLKSKNIITFKSNQTIT